MEMRLRSPYIAVSFSILAILMTIAGMAQDRVIRIARLGLVEGEVNYQRSTDEKDKWYEATTNLPLDLLDQIYTGGDGRAEVQLTASNVARLNHETNLKLAELDPTSIRLSLSIGTATFRITNLDPRRLQIIDANSSDSDNSIFFEVATPLVAVTFVKEGSYRITVTEDGTTEITVRNGEAEVFNREMGTVRVKQGRRLVVEGADPSDYRSVKAPEKDDWDVWNDGRDADLLAYQTSVSSRHVPSYLPGVSDLDRHGTWIESQDYGWVWSPTGVGSDWAPYRHGCWRWYPSHGWAWIGHEPWGWIPYHYGRWSYFGNRWCWVPQRGAWYGSNWSWSPSLVVFFGSRGNYGAGYRDGFGDGFRTARRNGFDWVGWVPLAPGERAEITAPAGPVTVAGRPSRDMEALRNYSAPGGISGVDGRAFDQSRVIVHGATIPPRRTESNAAPVLERVANDAVKPTVADTPRFVRPARTSTGRDLNAPSVTRIIQRSISPGSISPARSESSTSGGRPERAERPSRTPDFTPAERPVAPRSVPQTAPRVTPREAPEPSRESNSNVTRPSRSESYRPPSRTEAPPARVEAPAPPPRRVERSETPAPRPQREQQQSRPQSQPQAQPQSQPQAQPQAPQRQSQPSSPPPSRPSESKPSRSERPAEKKST